MGSLRTPAGAARLIFGSLLVAALTACPTAPRYDGPPFNVEVGQFAGTVLSGPLPAELHLEQAPWAIELTLVRVSEFQPPEGANSGEALASRALYVFAEPSPDPLKTRSELAVGVRVYAADTPLASVESEQVFTELIWPGSAVRFEADPHPAAQHSEVAPWTGFGWWFSRPPSGERELDVAVIFEGWVTPEADALDDMELAIEGAASEDSPPPFMQREQLMFSGRRLTAGERVRVVFPSPRPGRPHAAEILEARVIFEPDLEAPAMATAIERGRERLQSARELAVTEASAPPRAKSWEVSRDRAIQSLRKDPLNRAALLFLAESGNAVPTTDLIMVASDSWLRPYSERVLAGFADPVVAEQITGPTSLGWYLENETFYWLAEVDADPARELPLELVTLLLVHAGELGRYPDLLVETLRLASGREDAHRRIVAENRIFLEDSDPSSRVRAFDWLARREQAPAGFDPLAPITARRAALAAAEAAKP